MLNRRTMLALALTTAAPASPVFARAPALPLPSARPEAVGLSRERLNRIGDYLRAEIGKKTFPGASILVARRGGAAYFETFGERDPVKKTPMTADTIFRIYSMTKPIVSTLAMMLVEEGRITLDDPVALYIPAFAKTQVGVEKAGADGKPTLELVAARKRMTIQDLLRHSSGITYGFFGEGLAKKSYVEKDVFAGNFDNAEFAERIAALPLAYQPGTTWDYSHSTDILGRVIEVVLGKPLLAALKERIFTPLGMSQTSFTVPEAERQALIAEPFENDRVIGAGATVNDPRQAHRWESGGGGLVSTIGDYARFCQMVMNKGQLGGKRILGPKTIAYMAANHIGPGSGVMPGPYYLPGPGYGFGLGYAVRTETGMSGSPGTIGEINWGGAAGTAFWLDPQEDMFTVLMVQTPKNRGRLRPMIRNLVYASLIR